MNNNDFKKVLTKIALIIEENKDYLIQLDQQNGDGDLGISMTNGFNSISKLASESEVSNLGALIMPLAINFNETAPSSLGYNTILWINGNGKAIKR